MTHIKATITHFKMRLKSLSTRLSHLPICQSITPTGARWQAGSDLHWREPTCPLPITLKHTLYRQSGFLQQAGPNWEEDQRYRIIDGFQMLHFTIRHKRTSQRACAAESNEYLTPFRLRALSSTSLNSARDTRMWQIIAWNCGLFHTLQSLLMPGLIIT